MNTCNQLRTQMDTNLFMWAFIFRDGWKDKRERRRKLLNTPSDSHKIGSRPLHVPA